MKPMQKTSLRVGRVGVANPSSRLRLVSTAAAFAALLAVSASAFAAPITANDLVVLRVGAGGTGSTIPTSAATAVFLDEYSTTGTLVQTIALPTTAANTGNRALTNSGTATSEGQLSISPNGQFITFGGYNANVGTAGVASSAASSTANQRVVGVLDVSTGLVNTTTAFNDTSFTGNNIRSAVTDGTTIYAGGVSPTPAAGNPATSGVRNTTLGSNASTTNAGNPANVRVVNIFNGQVYASSGGSTSAANTYAGGIYALGSSTPVIATGTGSSPYDFLFTNANTVFVADDRTTTAGGLQQYTNSGSGFTLTNTFNIAAATGTGTVGLRGLTLSADGSTIFGTTTETTANRVVSFSLANTAAGFNTVATASANTVFRGVEFAPSVAAVPEPGLTVAMGMGFGLLGVARLRSKRKRAA